MRDSFRVGLVQNSAINDLQHNLDECDGYIRLAAEQGADLICLPEYFACLEQHDGDYLKNGFSEAEHPALNHYKKISP